MSVARRASTPDPRRAAAGRLFARGVSRAEVARRIGISRSTSSAWYRLYREGGIAALLARRRGGRRPRLSRDELRAIGLALTRSPREHGLPVEEWSLAAVSVLIQRRSGVTYHAGHVGRLVRRMGWIVPPLGAAAAHALYAVPLRDPDGNPLLALHDSRRAT